VTDVSRLVAHYLSFDKFMSAYCWHRSYRANTWIWAEHIYIQI